MLQFDVTISTFATECLQAGTQANPGRLLLDSNHIAQVGSYMEFAEVLRIKIRAIFFKALALCTLTKT